LSQDAKEGRQPFFGSIARFTSIDKNKEWFDSQKWDTANPSDLPEGLSTLSERYHPNREIDSYIFDPLSHIMVIASKTAPSVLQRGLSRLFNEKKFQVRFGGILVEVVKNQDKVQEILKIDELKSLRIKFSLPNPDELSAEADKLFKEFQAVGVGQVEHNEKAAPGKKMEILPSTRTMLELTVENGRAIGKGFVKGKETVIDTKDHPYYFRVEVASDDEIPAAVKSHAPKILETLRERRSGNLVR